MASVTRWTRLEPHPVSDNHSLSLRASIHDPLWLLARQWQLGEFQGEDNGTPVWVDLTADHYTLNRYLARVPGHGPVDDAVDYNPLKVPLETLVEREIVDGRGDYRLRAESGAHFLKLLADLGLRYRQRALESLAFLKPDTETLEALDEASNRFIMVHIGRSIDGLRLYQKISNGEPLFAGASEHQAVIENALTMWLEQYTDIFAPTPKDTAWQPGRLGYGFAVSSPMPLKGSDGQSYAFGETNLVAADYSGGHLDWHAFTIDFDTDRPMQRDSSENAGTTFRHIGLPTPVAYNGMPASRFWEFEDGSINFGAVDVAPEDFGRLLLMEFALVYGNDFFIIPVQLPLGTLCRIKSLQVTNTFGETIDIPAANQQQPGWRLFEVSKARHVSDTRADFLFLPPVLGDVREGQAVEEVLFARDEMANIAWAIEREIQSPIHKTLKRHESASTNEPTAAETETVQYRIASKVPPHWYPLIPVMTDPERRSVRLNLRVYDSSRAPLGKLLKEGDETFQLNEEEVPRSGVRVTRAYQYARWMDGTHHLWIGRRKQPGRGESSSGLRFDYLDVQRGG